MGRRFRFVSARAMACLGFASIGALTQIAVAIVDPIFRNGFEQFTLTVNDYLNWCSVTVNGGPPSSSLSTQYTFNEDVVVALTAKPLAGFQWGYWMGTDADNGAGDPGTCSQSTC